MDPPPVPAAGGDGTFSKEQGATSLVRVTWVGAATSSNHGTGCIYQVRVDDQTDSGSSDVAASNTPAGAALIPPGTTQTFQATGLFSGLAGSRCGDA